MESIEMFSQKKFGAEWKDFHTYDYREGLFKLMGKDALLRHRHLLLMTILARILYSGSIPRGLLLELWAGFGVYEDDGRHKNNGKFRALQLRQGRLLSILLSAFQVPDWFSYGRWNRDDMAPTVLQLIPIAGKVWANCRYYERDAQYATTAFKFLWDCGRVKNKEVARAALEVLRQYEPKHDTPQLKQILIYLKDNTPSGAVAKDPVYRQFLNVYINEGGEVSPL